MVGHDSEATIDVGNCNNPGCYSRTINYVNGATTKQLVALIDISTSCRQSIRVSYYYNSILVHYYARLIDVQYDCFSAPLEFSGVQESWWNDRSGVQRYFWAGPYNNDQHTCQCGIDKNCVDPSQKCNCDAMAIVQLNDNGFYTLNCYNFRLKELLLIAFRLRNGQEFIASDSIELWSHCNGIEW